MEGGKARFFNEIIFEEKKKIPPANWKKYQKEMNRIYEALQEAKSIEEYYGILKYFLQVTKIIRTFVLQLR